MYNPFSFFSPSHKKEEFKKEKEQYIFVTFWDSSLKNLSFGDGNEGGIAHFFMSRRKQIKRSIN